MSLDGAHPGVRERQWGLQARMDSSVTFEEFTYWAKIERKMEEEEYRRYKAVTSGQSFIQSIKGYFTSNAYEDAKVRHDASHVPDQGEDQVAQWSEKKNTDPAADDDGAASPIPPDSHDLDAEWRQAARAMRIAGWGSIFYLITTDILGWGQTPYVFSNTGYGLGVGIFLLMGLAAGASGFMIWRTFLALDSARFPVISYGDPFFRLFGRTTGHFINGMQALQMFLSVAVVLLGQTGIIAQLAGSVDLCYIVCAIISLIVSMVSGYMRSLKHLGWFCNAAVWINIVSFIIVIAAAAKYGPDPTAAVENGILNKEWAVAGHMAPVKTFVGTPPAEYQPTDTNLFAAKFNGINSMVYAYSGAIMFVAFLSEMRHPMDFWKAMLLAQTFITVVYIFFGAIIYHWYGQYSYVTITQVVKPDSLQVLSNVLSLVTGWLAIFLYFNVGMKTVYLEVGQEIFKLPPITSSKGRYLWWALGPVYWIIAFVVSMSVPQFGAFTNFVGGLFSLNFTYSLSGFMYLGYKIHEGAQLPGEGFDPATGVTTRHDSGLKRWTRGFLKNWYITVPVLCYAGAGLATSGMGTWAAVLALEAAFGPDGSVLTSWTCTNPYYTG
ncbi:hypothetical protein ASPZODRAFT_154500 [Penicilliopsis zonata CBS 506.65]|uniref:Amino acid transporter transmembrane domain-containing protein n=1 Tax=Penicilliopsis zonata CBS 506.65 TaxID=1073090 RepID=A0A1L9S942_9EURO|nr:hypothetical protein ASPZODRAFT_154500 [Penicilliopsis zonata CBS 506.65]OJJ43675.1 hypothetical protein ASPZODRAFT_154500 [Penicilliopsis zonata CBS 506.65]